VSTFPNASALGTWLGCTLVTLSLFAPPRFLCQRVCGVSNKDRDQVNFVDVDGNDILQRRC
jgi:hypothetical protein